MTVRLFFKGKGAKSLSSLTALPTNIKAIVKVTMHQEGRRIRDYIRRAMTSTVLTEIGTSRPGAYPAVQSGRLRSSVGYLVNSWDRLEFGAEEGYGSYLEKGTSRMDARPFISPSLEVATRSLERALITNLRKVMSL
jgi:hypothetical protein